VANSAVANSAVANSPAASERTAARQPAPAASGATDAQVRPEPFICGYLGSPDINWSINDDEVKALIEQIEAEERSKPPAQEVASPATSHADKWDDAARLAADELAMLVAHEHIDGTWRAGPLYWDDTAKRTTCEARLLLSIDSTDPLADAPFVDAGTFQVDVGPPPHMLSHADPVALHRTARRAGELGTALGLARTTLKHLKRYTYWKEEHWRYETRIWLDANGHVFVSFHPPNVTDNDISIEIDPAAPAVKRVVAVRLGMA
jgi:hypothetical protein